MSTVATQPFWGTYRAEPGTSEPDEWRSGVAFLGRYAHVVSYLASGARVLDCACGSGRAAIALARLGFRVHASDASAAMVARARSRAAASGVEVDFHVVPCAELPGAGLEPFDAVFCSGESLARTPDEHALTEALRGVRGVLAPGGTLALDTPAWERLRDEGLLVSTPERTIVGIGRSSVPMRVWTMPSSGGDAPRIDLVSVFGGGGELRARRYELPLRPFPAAELERSLTLAGLDVIDWSWDERGDGYTVIAERPDAP